MTDAPGAYQVKSWQDAEVNAARWLQYWGYSDAHADPGGPDAGLDVRATGAVGQVKYQATSVGRPALQRLVGAAPSANDALFFFTGTNYSRAAMEYAAVRRVALFVYGVDGTMTPVNDSAREVISRQALRAAKAHKDRFGFTPIENPVGWADRLDTWLNRHGATINEIIRVLTIVAFFGAAAMLSAGGDHPGLFWALVAVFILGSWFLSSLR